MKNIFVILSAFFKSFTSRIFLFLVILLGILLSFMHNDHLQKTNINKKSSKTINNSSKLSNTNKTTNKIKSPYLKYAFDNYIPSGITGKARNLNKFIDKALPPKNLVEFLDPKKNNLLDLAKQSSSSISSPTVTGYAVPFPVLVYTRPPVFFFPPPVVVVTHTTAVPPIPPPIPPPVPIPEPSSMILVLTGLSGLLGLRKKRALLLNN